MDSREKVTEFSGLCFFKQVMRVSSYPVRQHVLPDEGLNVLAVPG
jgi:hypothetical protein